MVDRCRLYFNAIKRIGKPTSHLRLRLLQYMEQYFGEVLKQEWDEVHAQAVDEFFESFRFKRLKGTVEPSDVLQAIQDEVKLLPRPKPELTIAQAASDLTDTSDNEEEWPRVADLQPRQLNFDPDNAWAAQSQGDDFQPDISHPYQE